MSYVIDCTSQLKTFSYQWKKCHVPWSILIESSDASDKFLYTSVPFFSTNISNISSLTNFNQVHQFLISL